MSAPSQPTILYPNGNENILARSIIIEWRESYPVLKDSLPSWYEIYYTDNYDYLEEPDWKMIAVVPVGVYKYEWNIGNFIKSDNVRIAIRSVNSKGERSQLSISASNFSIKRSLPQMPSLLSPVPGGRYSDSVKILFDESSMLKSASRRAKYYIYFRSSKLNIPLTPIAQRIPIGFGPIVWDVHLLEPSDDYIITAYVADDDGNKSEEVNVVNVSIINEGFFLIDTTPPETYIQINNGNEYTKDRNVSVRLFSYDNTTSPHSMQIIEGENIGGAEKPQEIIFWTLSEEDGVKTLQVKYQDFGGNRSSISDKIFRTFLDVNNSDIADIVLDKKSNYSDNILWVAVNGDYPSIYKCETGPTFITNVNENINSISLYNEVLYVAVSTADSTGLVYRVSENNKISEAFHISDADSEITSIQSYNNRLYIACVSGSLYYYDGKIVNFVYDFDDSIKSIFSDNSLLYITFYNSNNMNIYNGKDFNEVIL